MISIPSYLANLLSCVLYLRPFGDPAGGTTFRDWSPYRKTITLSGAVTNSQAQRIVDPTTIYLDGSGGYLYADASSHFLFPGDFAVSCSYVPQSVSGDRTIFGTNSSLDFRMITSGANWYMYYAGAGSAAWSNPPTVGGKYQIDLIRSGSTLTGYINGVSSISVTTSASIGSSSVAFNLGRYSSQYAYGYVGEIAVWNGSLGKVPTITQLFPRTRRLIV